LRLAFTSSFEEYSEIVPAMDEEQRSLKGLDSNSVHIRAMQVLRFLQAKSRSWLIVTSFVLLAIVGMADYLTGFERSLLVFYLLPVSLGAWFVDWRFAVILSVLSVAVWIGGDIAAGAVYSSPFVPVWNASIAVTFFLVVIWLLTSIRTLLNELEDRIRQRTAALRHEMETRERLEKEVTESTERERQRIGHELHDTLCQHLTGTSLALQVLSGKLAGESLPQVSDADRGVELVEQAIHLTRNIASGLFPLELEGEGLAGALLELSRNTSTSYHVACEFKSDSPVRVSHSTIATHLYRIAQEAVTNAVKHGHVSRIVIELSLAQGNLTLTIKDDGIGLPEKLPGTRGLGLRIMSSRAGMIGGSFLATNNPEGGAIVMCRLAIPNDDTAKSQLS
jgi:signal transduction histidine kinase